MDDKVSRRGKTDGYGGRRKRGWERKIEDFWQTYKGHIFTGAMLLVIVALLFGIFSQFQPPVTSTVPNGTTSINYSTFIQQVKAGNVQAVIMRDNEINGLLVHALGVNVTKKTQTATATQNNSNADYDVWYHYVNGGSAGMAGMTGDTSIDMKRAVYTMEPVDGNAELMPLLVGHHVKVEALPASQTANWVSLLLRLLPLVALVIVLLVFFANQNAKRSSNSMDERFSQMGKSRARRFGHMNEKTSHQPEAKKTSPAIQAGSAMKGTKPRVRVLPPVTFAEVAGIDEVRTELEEIVQFLRSPERFNRLGARIPRGALLVGSPGTGKTLLAKAVAGEAGVPFFNMSASEFVEMFVGVGASRVRDLFNQARQAAPCVVFIDELDAVGRKRSMKASNNDERDQTLNQLLVELDGFDTRKAVVVLAATNRMDILDKALLRPGRFDRRITVSLPDRAGRQAILAVHVRNTPLHEDVSLERLARMTTGMSGADLANLVNEAALSAARRDMEHVTHECFEEALARVQLGALRPLVMSERDRRIIAYHEGGHALVAHHLSEADTVNRVTILPRGQSLGVTQFVAEEDCYNYSRESLMARIAVGLGGRVAEELIFGSDRITTGAENDLQMVTDLARRMVTRWGMSKQVGLVFADYRAEGNTSLNMRRIDSSSLPAQARSLAVDASGHLQLNGDLPVRSHMCAMAAPQFTTSGTMGALIDTEVQCIIGEGREMAHSLLTKYRDQLELLANELMEREQLDRTQFEALLKEQ